MDALRCHEHVSGMPSQAAHFFAGAERFTGGAGAASSSELSEGDSRFVLRSAAPPLPALSALGALAAAGAFGFGFGASSELSEDSECTSFLASAFT